MYPACPNSVIEAINHGIPVIGYNQGSMKEIIKKEHGKLLNVDSNFNFSKSKLLQAIEQINVNYKKFNLKLKYIDKKFKLNYILKNMSPKSIKPNQNLFIIIALFLFLFLLRHNQIFYQFKFSFDDPKFFLLRN